MIKADTICCVCMESHEHRIVCDKCKTASVCANCLAKLVSSDNHRICPVCRQPNWNASSIHPSPNEKHTDADDNNPLSITNQDICVKAWCCVIGVSSCSPYCRFISLRVCICSPLSPRWMIKKKCWPELLCWQ
jgi:hypothetical protein